MRTQLTIQKSVVVKKIMKIKHYQRGNQQNILVKQMFKIETYLGI